MKITKNQRAGKLAGLVLALTGSLASCTGVDFKLGFNAVYAGLHSKREEGYARVFTGANLGNDIVRVHHHGLNEISVEDTSTYFGRNHFGIEPGNIGVEAIVDMRMGQDGLFEGQPFYGIRDLNFTKRLGADWGFLQSTTNGENVNVTTLYGKNMGFLSEGLKPLSLEFFNSFDYKPESKDTNLTEITVDWNISGLFGLFVRQDTTDFRFDDSNYVIGGVLKL